MAREARIHDHVARHVILVEHVWPDARGVGVDPVILVEVLCHQEGPVVVLVSLLDSHEHVVALAHADAQLRDGLFFDVGAVRHDNAGVKVVKVHKVGGDGSHIDEAEAVSFPHLDMHIHVTAVVDQHAVWAIQEEGRLVEGVIWLEHASDKIDGLIVVP